MKNPLNLTRLIAVLVMAVVTAWGGHFTRKSPRAHHRTEEGLRTMSETKELSDVLKSAQTATSLSGLSMLLVNSSGEFVKSGAIRIDLTVHQNLNLDEIKEACILGMDQPYNHFLSEYGNLLFICIPIGTVVYQWIMRGGGGGRFFFRTFSSVWNPWKEISMTPVTT